MRINRADFDALMCKVFPSRLGEFGLRWFDRFPSASISSNKQLSTAFLALFVTNTKQKKTVDSLFGLTMGMQETLQQYASRYWELFNEIKGCYPNVVTAAFRVGLDQSGELALWRSRKERRADHELLDGHD
ncbi:hypothetical protein RHGRI_007379 [Rhododendron griersonianum]|uniref:Retrotransposon gag domain-containing protein n=1 Tax=Rhododendron griersonianum TaxID=479676 RepID=A0AAV6KWL2_9ERIC|nr:hypothetical protein RHGRI_007379 [Rhododendron griersonianum]